MLKQILDIEVHAGTKEERLPDFASDFPYIGTCSELDRSRNHFVPWHWHKAVELFYVESGELEYQTPKSRQVFRAGSGGLVNSGVLHMTKLLSRHVKNDLHIFDTVFLTGDKGSRIAQKYVLPVISAPQLELIALYPDRPEHTGVLELIRSSFSLSEQEPGYELKLRALLSEIWLLLFELSSPVMQNKEAYRKVGDKIKCMMIYVQEHYPDKITVSELAAAAYTSERECFRIFQEYLHMTPVDYMKSYRLQMACRMLAESREPLTAVSQACGLGSSSYFGKVFGSEIGCTPLSYRKKWQDNDKK